MDFMNVFQRIILSSLVGSIIVLMILTVKVLFREKLNPKFHYYIWLILLIKLIIPFGPQTPLNIPNIYEKLGAQNDISESIQIENSQQPNNTTSEDLVTEDSLKRSNKVEISSNIKVSLNKEVDIERVLFFVWMTGTLFLLGILLIGNKKLRKILRNSTKNISEAHKKILYTCLSTMNIKNEVEILYSKKVSSPSLCGIVKPKILIPANIIHNICNEEFKYIITHELCHLKSRDILVNWIINLLLVIYWFNPILLYGFRRMRQDCEVCCDSKAISYLEEDENIKYGNTIIRILELNENSKRLVGVTSMIMNSSKIKRRIIMISKYKKMGIKNILLGVLVVATIGGLGISINVSKVRADKNISEAKTVAMDRVSNTSNEIVAPAKEVLPGDSTRSMISFSSDVVIYNSHPKEDYPSGIKVTDVGVLISDKLTKEGIKSRFISCNPPTEYVKAYETTRNLITKNVKEYSNTILLDIHRDVTEDSKTDTKKILFTLVKGNPHYEANKKFVDSLVNNIKNSSEVKLDIIYYNKGISYFNQDLSNNSVLIEIGNNMSSDKDIEECVNVLVSALKNRQRTSAD